MATYIGDTDPNTYSGTEDADGVNGMEGADTLSGAGGVDSVMGQNGDDLIHGGEGGDILDGDGVSSGFIKLGYYSGADTIYGDAGADTIAGGHGDDLLSGGSDNDELFGDAFILSTLGAGPWGPGDSVPSPANSPYSAESDTAYAGTHDDTLQGGGGSDTIHSWLGLDVIDGGGGVDLLDYQRTSSTIGLDIDLTDPTTLQVLADGSSIVNVERLNFAGGTGADTVLGGVADDTLDGGTGTANALSGGAGDDHIISRAAGDTLTGGEGYDVLRFERGSSSDAVVFDAGAGADDGSVFSGFEAYSVTGGSGADVLTGADGADTLNGGVGDDTLAGGLGDDLYSVDSAGDKISDAGGLDTVIAYTNIDLTAYSGVENIQTSENGAYILAGNDEANLIRGGAGNDTMIGRGGADTLVAFGGFDVVDYAGESAGVVIDLRFEEQPGAGGDHLIGFEMVIGSEFADRLTGSATEYEQLVGGGGKDVISGLEGRDSIDGGTGADVIAGGEGDDTLLGGDSLDTLDFRGAASGVVVDLTLTTAQDTREGMDVIEGFETVFGSNLGDELHGDGHALYGMGGHDTFVGGAGADTMIGGKGMDWIDYASAASRIRLDLAVTDAQQTGGGGLDTVQGVEYVNGTAYGDQISGDAADNIISGNGGRDILNGRDGDDILRGDDGRDLLKGGAGVDTLSGGTNVDVFLFDVMEKTSDRILDLELQDVIDLSDIDANTTLNKNQAFVLVDKFHGVAGELKVVYNGTNKTFIQMDVDGDAKSDMTITVDGDVSDFTNFVL